MSTIKSPQEKKRLAYEDAVTPMEYPKAFRKNYPKRKAKAERAVRQKVKQVLKAEVDGEGTKLIRRKKVSKWGTTTVRQNLADKQRRRANTVGRKTAAKRNQAPKPASIQEDSKATETPRRKVPEWARG